MAQDTLQPSNDARATALAIAHRIYSFMELDAHGSVIKGTAERKKLAEESIKLVADAAKQLFEAVKQ
jgi:hypothetical protein